MVRKQKLQYLQSLRGIAALIVCLFHGRILATNADKIFGEGAFGVQLFFMISGFIMIYTTRSSSLPMLQQTKIFLQKRLIRVIPLYYVATFVAIAVKHEWNYFGTDLPILIKALLFLPTGEKIPLYVGWTLNFEVFFYLIFGFCLMFGKHKITALYLVYGLLLIAAPYFLGHSTSPSMQLLFDFLTDKIQINFIAGTALALLIPKLKFYRPAVIVSGTLMLIAFAILYWPLIQPDFITTVVLSAVIIAGTLILDFSNVAINAPKTFTNLGDISYSLYLVHPITLLYWPGVLTKMHLASYIVSWPSFVLWLLLSIILAVVSYRIIEKRLGETLNKRLIAPDMPKEPVLVSQQ